MLHNQLIRKIWDERVNQRIDSSLILFSELKSYYGLSNNQTFLDAKLTEMNMSIVCNCLALESSLARALRNKALSTACLQFIEREIKPAIIFNSFIYQFEKGISFFSENEWIESVHYFLKAKNLATDSLQKASCLINLVLCSENLDILNTNSLDELNSLIDELDSHVRQGIENQLHSLNLRNKYRNATLLETDFRSSLNHEINQSTYFLTFLEQIPYLTTADSHSRLEHFVKKPGHLFNKDFRIRTLTYQWADVDQNKGRLTDHIERIYLWTWKWIQDPLKFPLSPIVNAFKNFPWSQLDHIDKLSLDNQSQFLLALGWLALFDNTLAGIHQTFAKKIKFSVNHKYLMAEKNVQTLLLQKFERTATNEIEASILKMFDGYTQSSDSDIALQKTIIDLSNFTIKQNNQRPIHSKSLSSAASLLIENENITVDHFFNKTLSQLEYDHFLNSHQISNMIYKLNKILGPVLLIRQKDGLIFATGNKNSVHIKYADERSQILKSNDTWIKLVQELRKEFSLITENKIKSRNKKYVTMLAAYSSFSRYELQKELKLSKTESNRLIQIWLADNLISKKGFGKRTTYHFKNNTKKVS